LLRPIPKVVLKVLEAELVRHGLVKDAGGLRKQPAEEPLELTDVLPLALGLACGGALFDGCP